MRRPAKGVRVRLAPSATAPLHLGSARLALLNWLMARRHGGQVVLRLDESDSDRSPPEHAAHMEHDLRWLGLDWDETWRQGDRAARYAEVAEALKLRGRLYPCLESEDELRFKREARVRRNKSPVYDRAMLKLTPQQLEAAMAGGKRPYWRFRLSDGDVAWNDLVLGRNAVKLAAVSDPVLVSEDGKALHAFASVVDDMDAGITRIVRGDNALAGTGVALDILSAVGGNPLAVSFAHVPALRERDVRPESLTLRRLRGDGMEPAAIVSYLAHTEAEPARLAALAQDFDLHRAAPARDLDVGRLQAINRRVLRELSFADAAARLPPGATEAFWLAIRDSLDLLTEARGWWDVVAGDIVPPILDEEADLLRCALETLPPEPWQDDIFATWTAAMRRVCGRDPGEMSTPLRLALTGEEDGPDLAALLPLIGRARVASRLSVAAA